MQCSVADLRCKEVINVCTGFRMGFVCDVIINTATGQLLAIVVPGQCRFLGIIGREDDYVIPWECIRKIGDDLIIVEIKGECRREKHHKQPWF